MIVFVKECANTNDDKQRQKRNDVDKFLNVNGNIHLILLHCKMMTRSID